MTCIKNVGTRIYIYHEKELDLSTGLLHWEQFLNLNEVTWSYDKSEVICII